MDFLRSSSRVSRIDIIPNEEIKRRTEGEKNRLDYIEEK